MTAVKPQYREHPALIGLYVVGGCLLGLFGSWLLYAGSHPPAEARHGAVIANVLGLILAPTGILAILGGVAMHRAWRFISLFQALPVIWVVGSAGLLALVLLS